MRFERHWWLAEAARECERQEQAIDRVPGSRTVGMLSLQNYGVFHCKSAALYAIEDEQFASKCILDHFLEPHSHMTNEERNRHGLHVVNERATNKCLSG